MIARKLYVHLADHEWGNELMDRVARQAFAADPTLTVVEVREHGGWYLTYLRDGQIAGTANDMAHIPDAIRAFWQSVTRVEYAGDVRRPGLADVA